jgi:hypothetical protein
MNFVFKKDGLCDPWEEALFLAGMKIESHKDVRWTAVKFLFFGLFYRLVVWCTEGGKPFFKTANGILRISC